MGLSARHVGELVLELAARVRGQRVRDLEALPPKELVLVLEGDEGARQRLLLSADPEYARLHLVSGPLERHRGPPGPFYRRIEEVLVGATCVSLEQREGDRIVVLRFEHGAGAGAALVAELTGRHANLILCDAEGHLDQVLTAPRSGAARARLAPGATYAPPPGRHSGDPGPTLEASLPDPPALAELDPRVQARAAAVPLSWRVEAALGRAAAARRADEARHALARRLERRLKGARDALAGLEERRRACAESERVGRDVELLKSVLGELRRGAREALVTDWYEEDTPQRKIPLDPRRTPQKNLERLVARHKKLVRTSERLPDELELARARIEALGMLLERAQEPEVDVVALEEEALDAGWLERVQAPAEKRKKSEPRLPYRVFRGVAGSEIRVGRSARDNDRLTFKTARGNDLWLHTSDVPGSHVVLRLEKGAEPDPEELLDAGHLAVHFSPLRGTNRADVHVARCKEVKKPKRAPAGLVTLSGGRTLHVRVEPDRLERLLEGPRGPRLRRRPEDA